MNNIPEKFKNWIVQHNPSKQWDFSDLKILETQMVATIKESGSLDIVSLFLLYEDLNINKSLLKTAANVVLLVAEKC